jgi:hypothetical protein
MLSAEEPASNDQAPGPIIARVSEASSLGSNLVFDQVLRMVGVGPAWACATRPGSDRFFREEWIIDISRSRNYVCGSQEVRSS